MARRRRSPAPSSNSNDDGSGRQGAEEPVKSKKPANTAFRQQRLRAWQPVLTPRTIIVVWSTLAVILLAAGGVLFWLSTTVRDFSLDYTRCALDAPTGTFAAMPSDSITAHFKSSDDNATNIDPYTAQWQHNKINITYDGWADPAGFDQCTVKFNIPEDLAPPVVMYYKLENFYQNHRRYVNSFNQQQLQGEIVAGSTLNQSTTPSCQQLGGRWFNDTLRIIYPCGLIANSMFNDTFDNPVLLNPKDGSDNQTYPMDNNTNVAWSSERDMYGPTKYPIDEIAPPPNWMRRYPFGYTATNGPPDLKNWQAFHNWMRTAATSVFTKPYQRNDNQTMTAGTYQMTIVDNFNVTAFNGQKFFVISTLSALGGRNPWVGIIFLVTGGFCLIMTIVFSVGHLLRPRKMGDHTYLSWNNVPGGAAGGAAPAGAATGADPARGAGVRQR